MRCFYRIGATSLEALSTACRPGGVLIGLAALLAGLAGCDRHASRPPCGSLLAQAGLDRFEVVAEGVVRDARSGLHWFRCNAGQRFVSGDCVGPAQQLPLALAHDYAQDFSAAAGRPWRLPDRAEMATLGESRCRNPAVNPVAFPGVLISNYWTAGDPGRRPLLGCTFYTYNGQTYCRKPLETPRPFMLVLAP